jgi:anaerobic selenocysteine-containing dehydrogenase
MHAVTAQALDIGDDDWVWIESANGRVKGQVRLVEGVNPDTVWTWNAIGKRRGVWSLKDDAAEANRGFLLNHAIGDLLPPAGNGKRYSNSDPITGQAAWFDLRVRVRKCGETERDFTEPRFDRLKLPPGLDEAPDRLSFGAEFRPRKDGTR